MTDVANGTGACGLVMVEQHATAVIKAKVRLADIRDAQRSLRRRIEAAIESAEVGEVGHALTLWRPPADGVMDMEPGFLVSRAFTPVGDLVPSMLPAGRAAHLRLEGGYEGIPGGWQTLFDWCATQGVTLARINWEIYEIGTIPQKTSLYALIDPVT